jgi:phosphomannomutase
MNEMYQYPRITISGARGIIGEDLTVESAMRMAWAYANMVGRGPVVLARDARRSGSLISKAVETGLIAGGVWVVNIDLAPTPTVGIMIRHLDARGGINITASHNPVQWNALKMFGSDGTFPDQSFVDEYVDYLKKGEFRHVLWNEISSSSIDETALEVHSKLIENAINCNRIRDKGFKVVVDGCSSVGGHYIPPFLEQLGCEVVRLDCTPNGAFQRGLEPIPENLDRLCIKVQEEKADIGLAADPDADRLAIVSNEGKAIGEEFTLAFSTYSAMKQKGAGIAVSNLSTSMLTDFAAKQAGGSVIRTAIGEANVAKAIREHDAVIGGEGNGGVMDPAIHNGRDSLTAAAHILYLLADTGQTVSELAAEFPNYVILKDKIEVDLNQAKATLDELKTKPIDGEIDTQDGVKIIREDAWLHLRCSNTEPIVRIIAEAKGEEETQKLIDEGKELLK